MKRMLCFIVMVLLLFTVTAIGFGSINEYELPIAGVLAAPATELFAPTVSEVYLTYGTSERAPIMIIESQKVSHQYRWSPNNEATTSCLKGNSFAAGGGAADRLIFPSIGLGDIHRLS